MVTRRSCRSLRPSCVCPVPTCEDASWRRTSRPAEEVRDDPATGSGTDNTLALPGYRSKWGWAVIWATIWFALGLGGLLSPAWYALPLFGIAVVSLNDAVAGNR